LDQSKQIWLKGARMIRRPDSTKFYGQLSVFRWKNRIRESKRESKDATAISTFFGEGLQLYVDIIGNSRNTPLSPSMQRLKRGRKRPIMTGTEKRRLLATV